MKKATLVCLKEDKQALLCALQRCGEFMPIAAEGEAASPPDAAGREEQLLARLKPYREKKSFLAGKPVVGYEAFEQPSEPAEQLAKQAEEATAALAAAETRLSALTDRMEQLRPWLGLTAPVEQLKNTAYSAVFTGYAPSEELAAAVREAGGEAEIYGAARDGFACMAVCAAEDADDIAQVLKKQELAPALPPVSTGTVRDAMAAAEAEHRENEKTRDALLAQLKELSAHGDELELLADRSAIKQQRDAAPHIETDCTVYMQGWVRSDRLEQMEKAVGTVTDVYDLTFENPADDEVVPTVTKNNWFVTQFETITDMFSRPSRRDGIDPNPVMSGWYWIIFGMMIGDAGYGALMILLVGAFKWLKKPQGEFGKLVNVLFLSSFTTFAFGILFGSYFGEEWFPPLLFSPLTSAVEMLIFSLIVGVAHIFTGMIAKMVYDFQSGHPWDAIFDQLSWILIITGLGLLFLPATSTVGMVMAIVGAATVVLTAGRKSKGFGKITGGLLGLYNITGFMSDILSYSRILALSLATGVVGMVINILAGLMQGNILGFVLSLVVYVVGHLFNLAMNMLSAYVHDSRLQYIEFFNKFYEGGGRPFKPLKMDTKYVDVQ